MTEQSHPTPETNDSPAPSHLRRSVYLLLILSAAGIWTAALWRAEPLASANDRSRWCTVWSLVERGTYQIDLIEKQRGWGTIDKVRHEGHFYSTKPPLLPTLVAGVYWGVKQATGWDLYRHTEVVTRLTLLFVNILPMLAALLVLAKLVERYAGNNFSRIYVLIAAACATLLTPFLMTLNNHTIAAVSVIFSLYPAIRIVADGARNPWLFALCGFWAAFTCCNELPAALFGLALFALLHFQSPKATWMFFVPAALIPLGAFFLTNYLATGGWKPFYLYYGTEKYRYIHEGIPSYWMDPKGIDKAIDSPLVYFLHCTIGHHGIFSLSPLFLLTLATWLRGRSLRNSPLRAFVWLGAGLTVAVVAFYLTRTENYNYGGVSCALRWTLWLIPFWLVAMIPILGEWGERRWFQLIAGGLLAISTFSAWYPIQTPWQQPWLFTLMQKWEWIDYRDKPPKFERPLRTWFPSLPTSENSEEPQWIELAGWDAHGRQVRLRLTDAGTVSPTDAERRTLRKIQIRRSRGDDVDETQTYHIDPKVFFAGQPPQKFLPVELNFSQENSEEADNTVSPEEAYTFFRGLPAPRVYNNESIRYLKTPLRKDAFHCQKAAGQVHYRPPGSDQKLLYRCDLWLCNDVPFGILQAVWTVWDQSRNLVARHHLTAVNASRIFADDEAKAFVRRAD